MYKSRERETTYLSDSNQQLLQTSPQQYTSPVFADKHTEDLYNKLNDIPISLTVSQAELQRQAEQVTQINSHCSKLTRQQRSHLLQNCLIPRGVSLKQDKHNAIKFRSFSIIKVTLKHKTTLSQQQFQNQIKGIKREIVYRYDLQQRSITSPQSENKNQKSLPPKPPKLQRKMSLVAQKSAQNYKFKKFDSVSRELVTNECNFFSCMDVLFNPSQSGKSQVELIAKKIKPFEWQSRQSLHI